MLARFLTRASKQWHNLAFALHFSSAISNQLTSRMDRIVRTKKSAFFAHSITGDNGRTLWIVDAHREGKRFVVPTKS